MHTWPTQIFENEADTLGFDWGSVIGPAVGAGTNFGLSWLQSLGQGGGNSGGVGSSAACGQSTVIGAGEISICLDRMLGELQTATAGKAATEKLAMYRAFLQFLTSPQYFAQSDSPHYLGEQIRLFRDEYIPDMERQAALESPGSVTTIIDPTTGQAVTVPNGAGGMSTNTMLLIGGGILVAILLLKN
jgi:hypothetical protein